MGKRKHKKGRAARNAKNKCDVEPEELVKAPHSFVINRSRLGKNATELMLNFRKIMEPFTASQLKVQKQNVLKDFIHMAGPLNVTHLVMFSKSKKAMFLRIGKLPHGPTLTFQIKAYSLVRDVISSQKKSIMYEKLFAHHPLLVLNNFSGEGMHFKLMTTMFQNMFPSINVNKANLNAIRRCLLFHYNADDIVDLRQYAIKVVPTGVSKAVKKLIQSKVPDLSHYRDITEFVQKSGNLSESEAELDNAVNTVTLSQPISSRGNMTSEKSAIRLYEIGPRIQLQLVKIEEGIMTGEVMYHKFITKSREEIEALKARILEKKALKIRRREQQKKNVERKKKGEKKDTEVSDDELEDDLNWYRKEVGEDPDENILPSMKKRKAVFDKGKTAKKVKFSKDTIEKEKQKGDKESVKPKTFQEFLKRQKKKKEAKTLKQKAKRTSQAVLAMRAKHKVVKKKKKV